MRKIIFFCILFLFPCFSCQQLITYKKFLIEKISYTGDELRIDGYFYCIEKQQDSSNKIRNISCFYRNGILLNMGGGASSLKEADEYIRRIFIEGSTNPIYEYSKWGLFVIDGQTIKFELYYSSDDITKWTYIKEGIILNDTTFHITAFYRSDGAKKEKKDEIYLFRQFSPKPDSIVASKWIQ